jgi:two-component system, cell cycle sensor histidine kinase and response regulator CckA
LNERTILVVDDEPSVLELVGKMLRRQGYAVVTHSRADGALAWATEHPGEAHLVISDVVMPGMNGLELAEALRNRIPGLPILFVSGYPDRVPRSLVSPVAPLLQKPFTPAQLLDAVQKLLGA